MMRDVVMRVRISLGHKSNHRPGHNDSNVARKLHCPLHVLDDQVTVSLLSTLMPQCISHAINAFKSDNLFILTLYSSSNPVINESPNMYANGPE